MAKTDLQKEFESLTPTARYITGNEYNLVYCAFLETRVEQLKELLEKCFYDAVSRKPNGDPFYESYEDWKKQLKQDKCKTFVPDMRTTSATICAVCGREKWEH